MEKKLRILQLTPRFPFPTDDGGKIGIANIFMQFSYQGCDVTLVALNNEILNKNAIEQAQKYGKIEIIEHSTNNTLFNIVKALLKNEPLYFSKHISNKIKSKLDAIIKTSDFDIIHADHSCMAPSGLYVKSKLKIPLGLRLHNIEWQIWEKYSSRFAKLDPRYIYLRQQSQKVYEYEKIFYDNADVCFAITDNDYKTAKTMAPQSDVIIAGPGINKENWTPIQNITRNQYEIVIATTFRWIHNIDAMQWLIKEVLPIIKEKIPDVKLTIIGKGLPRKFFRLNNPNIEIVGYIEDVIPYLSRANIYVAPLFVGGGVRIKILEALAMKLPVVATPVSAEGIHTGNENGLFIADNKYDFANAVIMLLNDYNKARELGEQGRNFVVNNFSWEKSVSTIIHKYKELLNHQSIQEHIPADI